MATITNMLAGFPLVNQINEVMANGAKEVNDTDDCVACSLAACITQQTGVHHTGSELKDAVYGVSYRGPTDPARYIAYAASLGVQMTAEYGDPAQLVQIVHNEIAAGHPVLITMPWPWDNAAKVESPGVLTYPVTHEGAACGVGPGWIRVMNPWGGFFQDQPDSWWQARLCYGKVYVCKKTAVPAPVQVNGGHTLMTLSLSDPVVSRYFQADGDGWRSTVTPNALIRGGMLQFYQTVPAPGSYAGLTLLGLPQTDETDVPGKPGVKVTLFERGAVAWDVNHELDHPVGSTGPAYLIHREQVAQFFPTQAEASADVAALQQQLASTQAQLAQAQKDRQEALSGQNATAEQLQAAKMQLADMDTQLQALDAKMKQLEAELASAGQSQASGGPDLAQLEEEKQAALQERDVARQRLEHAEQEHQAVLASLRDQITALSDEKTAHESALQIKEQQLSLIEMLAAAPASAIPALVEALAQKAASSASTEATAPSPDASVAEDVPDQEAAPAPSQPSTEALPTAQEIPAVHAPVDGATQPAPAEPESATPEAPAETLAPTTPALEAVPAQPAPESQPTA